MKTIMQILAHLAEKIWTLFCYPGRVILGLVAIAYLYTLFTDDENPSYRPPKAK